MTDGPPRLDVRRSVIVGIGLAGCIILNVAAVKIGAFDFDRLSPDGIYGGAIMIAVLWLIIAVGCPLIVFVLTIRGWKRLSIVFRLLGLLAAAIPLAYCLLLSVTL